MNCAVLEPDEIQVDVLHELPQTTPRTMISSLHVENFRCFQTLDLKEFGKYNIIVGDNGSGKTALLEALFLPGNGLQITTVLRHFRGMVSPPFSPEKQLYESLFGDLFFGFSADSQIKININGSSENSRSSKLYYTPPSEIPLFPEENSKNTKVANRIFTFESTDAENKTLVQKLNLDGNVNQFGACKVQKSIFVTSSGIPNPSEAAQRLSNIKQNSETDFKLMVETLYKLFPQISDISILLTGGTGEIFCKVEGIPKLVPVSLASNGLNKILNNLLSFPSQANGVVIIDEIENGIYYKRYPELWDVVITFCKKFDVQLFVSTHSKECLDALIPYVEKEKSDFRLIRTESHVGGGHTARISKGGDFLAALETGTEIR
jgi:AAA15 family ATPase/GTPase